MKKIRVNVFRSELGDCTAGGITGKENSILLFSADSKNDEISQFMEKETNDNYELALRVVKRGEPYTNYAEVVFKKAGAEGTYMAGGNFLYSSDSRYKEIAGTHYPISAHDRFENWKMYETLSK